MAVAALLAVSTAAQAQTTLAGICGRTAEVRDALLDLIENNEATAVACADVTDEHLAVIGGSVVLELNKLGITALAAGDFAGLTSLPEINLDRNKLTSLPAGVFAGLTSLREINLDKNKLTSLPAGVFAGLTSLWSISLGRNMLTSLPAGVFAGLTSLNKISLDRNMLTSLPAGVFAGLTSLQQINLDRNKLTSLPAGVFAELIDLKRLLLESNQLETLPDNVFEPLTDLLILQLSGNPGPDGNKATADFAPVAVALPDGGTVSSGGTVALDGSGSGGAWGTNVTYLWELTDPASGVMVMFDDDASVTPVVTITELAADTKLTFTLTVTGRGEGNASGIAPGTDTATVTVTATASADATLESLTVNDGTSDLPLAPPFVSDVHIYTAVVGKAVTTVTLTAMTTDSDATVTAVTLDGNAIADTDFTDGIEVPSLLAGENEIVVTVRAEDTSTTQTYTVTVTREANTAPTAINSSVTTDEDTAHTFATTQFSFADDDGDALESVTVVTPPAAGALALGGAAVTADQEVAAADIGQLVFTPAVNANGTGYASFTFKVSDGIDESDSAYTMTVHVTAVNDAATGAPGITGTAEVGKTLTAGQGDIDDIDGVSATFPDDYSFEWVRVDADGVSNPEDISGETGSTYTLTADDVGKKVRVKVSFSDDAGNAETLTSEAYPSGAATITASADATLESLTVNDGSSDRALVPAFASGTHVYAAEVDKAVTMVTLTAMTTDSDATVTAVTLDGNAIADTDFTDGIEVPSLLAGENGIVVRVRAADTPTTQTYTVTVTREANTAPTALNGSVTTDEDTPHTFAVGEFSFADDDGDALESVTVVTPPAAGALALGGAAVTADQEVAAADIGQLVFTPAVNANGTGYASFTFKVSDGIDESDSAYTMTVHVTAVNDAATGAPGITGTAQVGKTLTAGQGDIDDIDGVSATFPDDYSFEWVRVDADGVSNPEDISGETGSTYTPADADVGKKLQVKVSFMDDDNSAEELTSEAYPASGTVEAAPNVAPVFTTSETFDVAENQTAVGMVQATDADDDVTGYTIEGGDDLALFMIDLTSGVLAFNTAPNYEAAASADGNNTYVVDVRATSGVDIREKTTDQTITVTVTDVDEPPGAPGAPTVESASVVSVTATWVAPSNAGPAIEDYDYRSRVKDPEGSWVEVTDTTITALRATIDGLAENTEYDVQVRATNAEGMGQWSEAGFGSTDANTAPTAINSSVTTDEDTPHTFAVGEFSFADDDGDALVSVTVVTPPAAGELALGGAAVTADQEVAAADIGQLVFTPAVNANGTGYASFTFKVSDGIDESDSAYTMTVHVTAVNDAATGAPGITGTAEVGKTLTAGQGDIDDIDGVSATFPDDYSFEWVRVDADGVSNPEDISGETGSTYTLTADDVGKKVRVKVSFSDDAGNAETLTSEAYPSGAATITASADATLESLTVHDGTSDRALVPAFASGTHVYAAEVDKAVTTVTLTATTTDSGATVTAVTLNLTAIADTDFTDGIEVPSLLAGENEIVVTVRAADTPTTQTYTVTVTREANTAPTALNGSVTTDEDTPHTFAVGEFSFADGDGDALESVTVVTPPAAGALALGGAAVTADQEVAAADIGQLVFTPAVNANGTGYASFTFKVSDGIDESDSAYTMTVHVTAVNDAATGAPGITGTAEVGKTLTAGQGDIDDIDGVSATFPDDYSFEWVRVDADGVSNPEDISGETGSTYTPADADVGKKLQVKVSFMDDDNSAEELTSEAYPASGTVEAAPNEPPVFGTSATFSAAENQTAVGTVLATDGDADDNVTGYTIQGGADQSLFAIEATTGVLAFTSAPNHEAPTDVGTDNTYVVEVRATSGTGIREKATDQTITVTVTDVDEPPSALAAPRVSSASVDSVAVTWVAPTNAGPAIEDYDYQYRVKDPVGSWVEVTDPPITALSVTIEELAENTEYEVAVCATNAEGTSDWSDPGSGSTDANAAPAFSSSTTFDVAENQLAVATVTATDANPDDSVTGYTIQGGADQSLFAIEPSTGDLTFKSAPNYEAPTDADTNNTYVVQVRATSGTGMREKTTDQTITVTVTDVEKPGVPGAPTVSSASVDSVRVIWVEPSNEGPEIEDYDYRYRVKDDPQGSWMEVTDTTSTALRATIEGLAENTEYEVAVRATNAEGTSEWSEAGSGTATNIHMGTKLITTPPAWLARFGRTVAEQVLDAVKDRLRAAPRAGVEAALAGEALPSWDGGSRPGGRDRLGSGEDARDAAALAKAEDAEAQAGLAALTDWLPGDRRDDPGSWSGAGSGDGRRATLRSRAVTGRDFLTGTSFALTAEAAGGAGLVSLWGRGALTRFDGRERGPGGDLRLEGEVGSAMLGADWTGGRDRPGSGAGAWTAGLLLAHSRGEGSYRGAVDGAGGSTGGTLSSSVTGLYPYGRYRVTDRVALWGVASYGAGMLTLTPEDGDGKAVAPLRTDMELMMAALGVRGVAVEAPSDGGFELAGTSDAMVVRTSSEKTSRLEAATAGVTRVRLGLEGSWRGLAFGGHELTPSLEVGIRHDDGDAETGFGADIGPGLAWSHAKSGISAEVSARGLLTHAAGGFRDQGIAGSFSWRPRQGSDRGPSLTLSQTLGGSSQGGMDALLGRETLAGLAADDNGEDGLGNRRLDLRFGYGFSAIGDRFTSTPELGLSNGRREMSLGWRLNMDRRGASSLELRLEATRRESANDNAEAENGIGFRLTGRW